MPRTVRSRLFTATLIATLTMTVMVGALVLSAGTARAAKPEIDPTWANG